MVMNKRDKVTEVLKSLDIGFRMYEHPPLPTIEIAKEYWEVIPARHCKNLFFRNHKGNRHYLVIIDARQALDIHDLEKRLGEGKISFASDQRLEKYLGLKAGSVSPLGLINDSEKHVYVFLDETLKNAEDISFHPNDNTATLVLKFKDFEKFLSSMGNGFEFLRLYEV
jgi:Ala-tRNA(Pro) deacylase